MKPFKRKRKKGLNLASLQGELVKIRKYSVRDAIMLSELLSSDKVKQRFFAAEKIAVDEIAVKLMETIPLYDNENLLVWAIVDVKDSKKIFGQISIKNYYPEDRICSIDFWIGEQYWDSDILEETIKVVTKYLIEDQKLHRVQIKLKTEDEVSKNILAKCGFQFEGVQRERRYFNGKYYDLNTYAILETDRR